METGENRKERNVQNRLLINENRDNGETNINNIEIVNKKTIKNNSTKYAKVCNKKLKRKTRNSKRIIRRK